MKKKQDMSTCIRYAAFQVPSLVLLGTILFILTRHTPLNPQLSIAIIIIWILKDIILYPFMKRYYTRSYSHAGEKLIGQTGLITSDLNPKGYIRIGMELWRAIAFDSSENIKSGDEAVVVALEGLTLYVTRSKV